MSSGTPVPGLRRDHGPEVPAQAPHPTQGASHMSAVPKASNSLALPMGNAAGMGRVCAHLDVKALRQGRQQGWRRFTLLMLQYSFTSNCLSSVRRRTWSEPEQWTGTWVSFWSWPACRTLTLIAPL